MVLVWIVCVRGVERKKICGMKRKEDFEQKFNVSYIPSHTPTTPPSSIAQKSFITTSMHFPPLMTMTYCPGPLHRTNHPPSFAGASRIKPVQRRLATLEPHENLKCARIRFLLQRIACFGSDATARRCGW